MKTIYDIVSVVLFIGLAILFLQRSASKEPDPIPLWRYGVAAVGCAMADFLGNEGNAPAAIACFVALVIFAVLMLRPFGRWPAP